MQRRPVEAREVLRNTYWGRALALTSLGSHAEALADWDRAIELADAATRRWLRLYRAATLARLGDHAKAVQEAAGLVSAKSKSRELVYRLAAVYALAAAAVRVDHSLPREDRQGQAAVYSKRAVELLQHALAMPPASHPLSLPKLEDDPDFKSLRSEKDFQDLLSHNVQGSAR